VPVEGRTLGLEEINEYLEGKLARFKHPRQIRFLDDLPLTTTMKTKKSALKEKYFSQRTDESTQKEATREAI